MGLPVIDFSLLTAQLLLPSASRPSSWSGHAARAATAGLVVVSPARRARRSITSGPGTGGAGSGAPATGESQVVPRLSDLGAIVASTSGKIELETLGEASEDKVLGKLAQRAVLNVFNKSFSAGELEPVVNAFKDGLRVEVSDTMSSSEYVRQLGEVAPLLAAVRRLGATEPALVAAALEFILEGLHLNKKLNKDMQAGHSRYRG